MFLPPKVVTSVNRYVENGPEDRSPSFKRVFPGRLDFSGGILRYSTTSAPKKSDAAVAMARIAKAGN